MENELRAAGVFIDVVEIEGCRPPRIGAAIAGVFPILRPGRQGGKKHCCKKEQLSGSFEHNDIVFVFGPGEMFCFCCCPAIDAPTRSGSRQQEF